MTPIDAVLVVVTSAVTTLAVEFTRKGLWRALLPPYGRPKPLDPQLLQDIYRSAARTALNGKPGTPPSAPRPPVE